MFCSCFGVLSAQPLQYRHADQSFLRLPHVVLCLRLDEWLLHQYHGLDVGDLVGNRLDQPIGRVLENHRLQRESCRS